MDSRWANIEECLKSLAKIDGRKTIKSIMDNYLTNEEEKSAGM